MSTDWAEMWGKYKVYDALVKLIGDWWAIDVTNNAIEKDTLLVCSDECSNSKMVVLAWVVVLSFVWGLSLYISYFLCSLISVAFRKLGSRVSVFVILFHARFRLHMFKFLWTKNVGSNNDPPMKIDLWIEKVFSSSSASMERSTKSNQRYGRS